MINYTAEHISTFLRAANADLGSNKYTGDQMIPDYCKAVIIGKQLQDELADIKQENEHLCNTIEATRQDMADMLAGTLEGKLQARLDNANDRLREMESIGCYIADETGHVCGVAEDNKRLGAAVGLALELADVESIKEVLQPWSKP